MAEIAAELCPLPPVFPISLQDFAENEERATADDEFISADVGYYNYRKVKYVN